MNRRCHASAAARAVAGWLLLSALLVGAPPAQALSPADEAVAAAAVQAASRGDWSGAQQLAQQTGSPVIAALVFWLKATGPEGSGGIAFTEIQDFLQANPGWPRQELLRRRGEEALVDGYDPDLVIAFFDGNPPRTANGGMHLATALLAKGRDVEAAEIARRTWADAGFSETQEQEFLARFGATLTADDHLRRLDTLLWDGSSAAAQRMLPLVGTDARAVAQARLALRRGQAAPEQATAGLTAEQRRDPGLVLEQVRWYRKNGFDSLAEATLLETGGDAARPDVFWTERAILARRALDRGDPSASYAIASRHALSAGVDLAEAEWFAGWLALRFLGNPTAAGAHFDRVAAASQMPITQARAAYWSGRALDASGRTQEAMAGYTRASQYPTTFYGQLAAATLMPDQPLPLPPDPQPTAEDLSAFDAHPLKQACDALVASARYDLLRPFLLKLAEVQPTAAGKALAAQYAQRVGKDEVSVAVAKQAVREGHLLVTGGYPTIAVSDPNLFASATIEPPLVLAIVRQESAFSPEAISSAGARGLMQLMPGTAREVAGQLNLPYSLEGLTQDTSYNLQLGQAYLGRLLNSFDGSYVLSLAAYNAGPGRVRQWLRSNGDPRGEVHTAIDWIERIPISETRNYVQRTMENVHVYRNRLAGPQVPLTVHRDVAR